MAKIKRVLAFSTAAAVLIIMLFSTAYIIHEADHDCTGDGCSICYQISACISTLKTLSYAVVAAAIAVAFTYSSSIQPVNFPVCTAHVTLVALKVKLSN